MENIKKESNFTIVHCKRDEYIKAWNYMYKHNKEGYRNSIYDGINPSLNKKPLGTEVDNFCTVVYDSSLDCKEDGFEYGRPCGIFCFIVTPTKIIGKQFVVDPDYLGKGLGKAILIENEKILRDHGYEWYYIGCSHCSAGIYKKYWNIEPYNSDDIHDLYKFDVELHRDNFKSLYKSIITDKGIKIIE